MADKYFPPEFAEQKFHCIVCSVYAKQSWSGLSADGGRYDRRGQFPVDIFKNAIFAVIHIYISV